MTIKIWKRRDFISTTPVILCLPLRRTWTAWCSVPSDRPHSIRQSREYWDTQPSSTATTQAVLSKPASWISSIVQSSRVIKVWLTIWIVPSIVRRPNESIWWPKRDATPQAYARCYPLSWVTATRNSKVRSENGPTSINSSIPATPSAWSTWLSRRTSHYKAPSTPLLPITRRRSCSTVSSRAETVTDTPCLTIWSITPTWLIWISVT